MYSAGTGRHAFELWIDFTGPPSVLFVLPNWSRRVWTEIERHCAVDCKRSRYGTFWTGAVCVESLRGVFAFHLRLAGPNGHFTYFGEETKTCGDRAAARKEQKASSSRYVVLQTAQRVCV